MSKALTLKYHVPEKIFEGVLSNRGLKTELEKKMEAACLNILTKEYSKLSPDLRKYLEMRYPDTNGEPVETQPTHARKLKKARQEATDVDADKSEQKADEINEDIDALSQTQYANTNMYINGVLREAGISIDNA